MIATGLCEVPASCDAKLDAQMLKEDRHEIGEHHDKQKRVTKLRPASQIGCPIARIHVTNSHEKTRAGEGHQLAPKRGCYRNDNTAMDFRQRDMHRNSAPRGERFSHENILDPFMKLLEFRPD